MIPLTFSPIVDFNRPQVVIINDNIHEDSEDFIGVLDAAWNQPVNISQDRVMITIVDDNDCMFAKCL